MQPTRGSKDTDHVPPKASRLFGLAPGGVCHAPSVTGRPVSFYLAVSPVPRLRQGFGRKNPACWQKNPDFFFTSFHVGFDKHPLKTWRRQGGLFSVALSVTQGQIAPRAFDFRSTLSCGVRTFLILPRPAWAGAEAERDRPFISRNFQKTKQVAQLICSNHRLFACSAKRAVTHFLNKSVLV